MCISSCTQHEASSPTNTTSAELFKALDGYISGKLKWSSCVGIYTDGAAAMTGWRSDITACNNVVPECQSTHCIIHREMLASHKMPPELDSVLNYIGQVLNHVKTQALNSGLFEQLCEEMDAEHRCLLLYTEIRWLSQGKTLAECLNYESRCKDFSQKRSHR